MSILKQKRRGLCTLVLLAMLFTMATSAAETADPLGKYDPPISAVVSYYTDSTVQYRDNDTAENNSWTRAYRDILGIDTSYLWMADVLQYAEKMNLTIASGDLPDIFPVNGRQLDMLLETDSIQDLTDVYEQYASPLTRAIYDEDTTLFGLGKRDGRLYGLANSDGGSGYDSPHMLWVREDWRLKLGLPEPKTMEDFYALAEAFATQDPDGNGANDTFALALTNTFADGFAGLQGFSNMYGAYAGRWIKDSSGAIVYGSIQPEVRDMLLGLQDMYAKGWIDREFAVKDVPKVAESTTTGLIGLEFGQMWNPFFPLLFSLDNNPEANWQPYPIPTESGEPAKVGATLPANYFVVVRKGFEHPEAAIKMINLFTEKCWGETADNDQYFNGDGTKYVPFKYAFVQAWPARKNLDAHGRVTAALSSGDTTALNEEETQYYSRAKAYIDSGDHTQGWADDKIFGANSSFSVISQYVANDQYMYNEYLGIPTPTMVERQSTLDALEAEVFTKIIMGDSIEEFDKFVENWKKLGGDDITKELNEIN